MGWDPGSLLQKSEIRNQITTLTKLKKIETLICQFELTVYPAFSRTLKIKFRMKWTSVDRR